MSLSLDEVEFVPDQIRYIEELYRSKLGILLEINPES
jgi:hypothetical protein